jgi:putative tryptophan/tyrosine transport system substrate-binding protein
MSLRRRDIITLLGGAAAWPVAARAQQPAMPVIGYLNGESAATSGDRLRAFRQGLSETGYVEGRNAAIEYRWADGQYDRLPALAADLVRRQVAVIVATGIPVALMAKAATTTIPIVFSTAGDPVALGLVPSLSRPGGNLTGVTNLGVEVSSKQLELLHEAVPSAIVAALLVNPNSPIAESESRDLQAAARTLGLELHVLQASTDRDLDTAFDSLARLRAGALVIGSDVFFTTRLQQLAELVVRHAVPAIANREFAAAGGLMGYATSNKDFYRQTGVYAGRILKGEKPADMPVQQVTKIELILNLKTAKALGIAFPPALLARADEVIE